MSLFSLSNDNQLCKAIAVERICYGGCFFCFVCHFGSAIFILSGQTFEYQYLNIRVKFSEQLSPIWSGLWDDVR